MQFTAIFATLAVALSASALPTEKRAGGGTWSPRIITPDDSTVWYAGGTFEVTWDIGNAPDSYSGSTQIDLGNNNKEVFPGGGFSEVIKPTDSFSLYDGSTWVTLPEDLPSDDRYFITLFGSSDNRSPQFKIYGV
ncbi:hypothetical protein V5O48_007578 [Marasmius crinis-equi]|uniref:Yeast cell wall synthesis Kre9/Knh1-like N-terminal domain-containing protein n=1 Tax=Marasmius crinis-equi TaxID=585013 RepID=A0ABR3FGE0_9AGAR